MLSKTKADHGNRHEWPLTEQQKLLETRKPGNNASKAFSESLT